MSEPLVIRAPGKLFLLGEYAVLDGCPAVVAAVDRHVEVRLRRTGSRSPIRIEAPGVNARAEFAADAVPAARGPLAFALSAFRSASEHLAGSLTSGLDVAIASSLADVSGTKTGLGSSAAVSVAMVAALFATAGRNLRDIAVRDQIFTLALAAHWAAQTGVGSGADVAASCYGGVVSFELKADGPQVRPLILPADVRLLVGWTGTPASTSSLVQRYLAARNGAASKRTAFVQESRASVSMFVQALERGTVSRVALDSNGAAIDQLGVALGLPLVTPRLQTLVALARQHGAAAKSSGAGGGDCGIALTQEQDAAARICSAWREAGIVPLDLQIDREGVALAGA